MSGSAPPYPPSETSVRGGRPGMPGKSQSSRSCAGSSASCRLSPSAPPPAPPPPSVTDGALALGVAMGENLQGKPRHAWRVTGTQPLPVPSPDSSSAMFPLNLSHQGKGQGRCSVCSIVQPRRQRQGVGRTGVTHDHPSSQLGCWNKNRSLGGSSNRHLSPLRLEAGRLRLRCPQTCLLVRTLLLARGRPPSPWVTYRPDDVEGELWSLLLF